MYVNFSKYHGTGNDFILIDNRNLNLFLNQAAIIQICDRRVGIGADGLMLLENDKNVDFRMRYFNADGQEASLCGNGGRCITAFAKKLGIIDITARFSAFDGIHTASINDDLVVKLKMSDTKISSIKKENGHYILNTGSPHYVEFKDTLEGFDVFTEGQKIRYSPAFAKEGINVNFAMIDNEKLHLITYERGVENVTFSCGTGAVATTLVYGLMNNISSGIYCIVNKGGILRVHFEQSKDFFSKIYLEGKAAHVFDGKINISD